MIEAGTFKARGVGGALGYTNGDEPKEQVAVELELLEGEDTGAHVTWYGFFTEKTIETTLKALRTLGWASDDLNDLEGIDANEVYAVIEHEEGQDGITRARVRWINSTAGGGLALKTKMDESQAQAFAARMKGHVLAAKARTNGTPAATATPAPNGRAASSGSGKRGGKAPPTSGSAEPPPF